ncbi:type II toxin-antitoxin system RelE/ParE family toxin [Lachnospiraceae bacterium 48-21]
MPDYNIILTHEVIQDITDIAKYIEIRFGTACADRFQNRLEKELSQLGYMGGIFYNTQILYKRLCHP